MFSLNLNFSFLIKNRYFSRDWFHHVLGPRFRETFLGYNCSLYAWVCSETPVFGQNTLMIMISLEIGGSLAQVVRRSLPIAGVPSSRLDYSITHYSITRNERNGVWVGSSRVFPRVLLPPISFHYFSTFSSLISFHFISSSPRWCIRRGRPSSLLITDLQ